MVYILTDVLFTLYTVDGTKKLYFKLISYIISVKRFNMLVDVHEIFINILNPHNIIFTLKGVMSL